MRKPLELNELRPKVECDCRPVSYHLLDLLPITYHGNDLAGEGYFTQVGILLFLARFQLRPCNTTALSQFGSNFANGWCGSAAIMANFNHRLWVVLSRTFGTSGKSSNHWQLELTLIIPVEPPRYRYHRNE